MYVYVFSVIMSLSDNLSVRLYVIIWQKIDQARGPETFFNVVWPNLSYTFYNLIKLFNNHY